VTTIILVDTLNPFWPCVKRISKESLIDSTNVTHD
jgi:hypothetical protein